MSRFNLFLIVAALAGCSRKADPHAGMDMAGMKRGDSARAAAAGDMAGMPGMDMGGLRISEPGDSSVPVDRATAAGLGITFARATPRPLTRDVRLAGTLAYAEPRQVWVNSRVDGWVERLDADYVGKPVKAGASLLALYAPELVSAQEEYLAARRLGDSSLAAAARRRLALWKVPDEQIAEVERTGEARRTLTIRAPRSGEIAEKMVIDGQAVKAGDNLFLIADRSRLWVDLAVFEMDARSVRVGVPVELAVDVLQGRTYRGRVTFIQPRVDPKTRTLTARVEVENPDGALRPGMYAVAHLRPTARRVLTVPRDAVLPTGTRSVVFLNRGDGHFAPREVVTGQQGDSLVEIVSGLSPGDEVVASATYLFDSEANLGAALQGLMLQMGMGLDMGGIQVPSPSAPAESAR